MTRLSDWLRPGEPVCETCGGTGYQNRRSGEACRDCGGFGSGPVPDDAPLAPAGSVCQACGGPPTADDLIVTWGPVTVHRSHDGSRR